MAADDPLTPAERLFAEAGYSRLQYLAWRVGPLPMLEVQAALSALGSGWPADGLEEQRSEATLARRWIEQQQRDRKESSEPASALSSGKTYGPSMPSREAIEVLEREVQNLGKHHSLKAFEKALTRAAGRARENPDLLPVPLGGQHKDWQLVSIGAGGHHGGHLVRRQLQ